MGRRSVAQTFQRRRTEQSGRRVLACAIDEALKCKEASESKTIAFNISGHGFMDMQGYREVLGLP
jgi:predicted alternative tryptophan synthase beta-subunit